MEAGGVVRITAALYNGGDELGDHRRVMTNGWIWDKFAADTRGLADGVNTDEGELPGRDVLQSRETCFYGLLWTACFPILA